MEALLPPVRKVQPAGAVKAAVETSSQMQASITSPFTTPDGTTSPMVRKIGYSEFDFVSYSGKYVHEPLPSAAATALTFTGEAQTSAGNGTAQILTIKGTDSGFSSSVVVKRGTDF